MMITKMISSVSIQDEPLGGWTIQRQVGKEDPVVYKFTPKYVLKAQSYTTVSTITKIKNNPPMVQ